MPRFPSLVLAAGAALLLGGCASQLQTADSLFGVVTPYRIDIIQGNVVTQEQIERVKPGMTRRQVRDLLGSPMLTDVFHADRWDYPFAIRRQGTQPQQRHIVVHFEGDQVARVDAPPLPTELEFVASISRPGKATLRKLELSEAERQALPVPPARDLLPAAPVGAVRSYPPLEAR